MLKYCLSGFPHSEIHGYNGYLLLPVAYRSLSRPSSAPDAKAFPLRSFQLDLSNHLLILKVELCRQFNRIFEIVIVTHLYDVPQLKLKIRSSVLSNKRPLCCLAYHFFITLFSFQGSIFQLLLQPDLKICLMPGLQIQQQLLFLYLVLRTRYDHTSRYTLGVICWWARVGSNHRPYDYQSYALASWATGPFVDTSSISLAALHAVRLAHFATSPLPRRPASLGSARILDDWLLYCFLASRKSVCFCGMVEIVGIEPATSCLQGRRSPSWAISPSYLRSPADFIACAL